MNPSDVSDTLEELRARIVLLEGLVNSLTVGLTSERADRYADKLLLEGRIDLVDKTISDLLCTQEVAVPKDPEDPQYAH